MEFLLSSSMHRRVTLLNLLNSSNGWMTSERLADLIGCSPKTVMLDCQYVEDRWLDYLTIETSRKSGIHLISSPHHSIHDIYAEIIQESNAFTLLEALFFNPKQTAEYWEQELFLSHSSLYRLSNVITTSLKKRNIEMSRSPYYIYGAEERQVRYFFTSYFLEVYGIHEWPFPFDKERIMILAQNINHSSELNLNDIQLAHLTYSIAVTIIREHQGFLIQSTSDPIKRFQEYTVDVRKYRVDIEEIVKPLAAKVPDNWYEDFCYSIFWWDFGWDNLQERVNITKQGIGLVETIKEALEIPITEESRANIVRMFEYIYAKHKMYPFKKYMVYNRFLYSSKAIKQSFVVFTAVVSKSLQVLENKTQFPWFSMYLDEILHEIVIRWESLPKLLDDIRHKVSVAVLSDLGTEHGQLLASILKDNFQEKIDITVEEKLIIDERKPLDLNEYDLYVSNYTIKDVPEINSVIVEDIPSFKNLIDLRKFIDNRRLVLPETIDYLTR